MLVSERDKGGLSPLNSVKARAESELHFESELVPDVPAVEVAAGEECFAVLHRVWGWVAARSHAFRPSVARGRHYGSPRAVSALAPANTLSHSASADA